MNTKLSIFFLCLLSVSHNPVLKVDLTMSPKEIYFCDSVEGSLDMQILPPPGIPLQIDMRLNLLDPFTGACERIYQITIYENTFECVMTNITDDKDLNLQNLDFGHESFLVDFAIKYTAQRLLSKNKYPELTRFFETLASCRLSNSCQIHSTL